MGGRHFDRHSTTNRPAALFLRRSGGTGRPETCTTGVIALQTIRPVLRALALLLLLVQGVVGVGVAWAHAAEPPQITVALESAHDSNCLVIHNEARCTICQFAGTLGNRPAEAAVAFYCAEQRIAFSAYLTLQIAVDDHLSAAPRAPPTDLV